MDGAVASLVALLAAIVISMVSRINVGLLAIAAAWLIGVYVVGMKPDAVLAGFPASLFLTLAGVTLLFSIAEVNRSFEGVATRAFGWVRGSVRTSGRTAPFNLSSSSPENSNPSVCREYAIE